MIQHFVVTPFNLRMQGRTADKQGRQVLTRDWLEHRLDLFEQYCLPSVMHQTEQRFTWLLLMDEATDQDVVERVNGYRDAMSNLEVAYLPPIASNAEQARPVLERVSEQTQILVTTRLDNDDALHEDALAEIRKRVRSRREFWNLRLGFVTDGQRARVISHKYSPFVTFVEPRGVEPFLTVYCGQRHGRLRKVAPVRQISGRPLWLRVIHERNAANSAFEERQHFHFRSIRGVHAWLRRRVMQRARRCFWPAAHRREYRLADVAPAFHIGQGITTR